MLYWCCVCCISVGFVLSVLCCVLDRRGCVVCVVLVLRLLYLCCVCCISVMLCTVQERTCSVCCIGVAFVVSVLCSVLDRRGCVVCVVLVLCLLYLCYAVYWTGEGV